MKREFPTCRIFLWAACEGLVSTQDDETMTDDSFVFCVYESEGRNDVEKRVAQSARAGG